MKASPKKSLKPKGTRPKIPLSTQLKLWVVSAGRCEFPGCNKSLLKDHLTLKEDKFAHIAHIIADSETGPRGHSTLSKELSQDFSNLMLLCTTHHRLIDGKNKDDYSIELLRLYKARHEERIKIQTEIQDDHTTTVLRFMSKIGPQPISIPVAQAYKAIYPHYPADEKGITIDLTNVDLDDTKEYWQLMTKQIQNEVNKHFTPGNDGKTISRLSIFAIAPIPLLIYLGHCLGNIIPMSVYQRHRDTQDWLWKSKSPENFKYSINKSIEKDSKNIAVVLSLSGKIQDKEFKHIVDKEFSTYEISIDEPDLDFLQSSEQLEGFRRIYRETITSIREKHGDDCKIHLFPAIPAPIALICGKELLRKVDPDVILYQKQKSNGEFYSAVTIK